MIEDIAETIEEIGQPLTLVKVTTGTYSPETSSASVVEKKFDCVGLVIEYKDLDRNGTSILATDKKAILFGPKFAADPPKTDDKLIDGDDIYKIVNARPVKKAGNPLIYSCQVRG